jgi:hypothetical protein
MQSIESARRVIPPSTRNTYDLDMMKLDVSCRSDGHSIVIPFGPRFRDLRKRLGSKQIWVASATGHTDAAVSYWETGKRLPLERTMHRILAVLARAGASATELSELHQAWDDARRSAR